MSEQYTISKESYRVWRVVSSKGRLYYVWIKDNKWICSCKYYARHNICKHIKLVKEQEDLNG